MAAKRDAGNVNIYLKLFRKLKLKKEIFVMFYNLLREF